MWARRQIAGTVLGAALLLSAATSSAPAASFHPKGEYAPFKECPLKVVTLTDCIYSVSDEGGFTVGEHRISLSSPLILQGGYEGAGDEVSFHAAANGETLVPAPQPLAGVLEAEPAPSWWPAFLREWFEAGEQKEAHNSLTSYIELAAPASEVKLSTENLLGDNRKRNQRNRSVGRPNTPAATAAGVSLCRYLYPKRSPSLNGFGEPAEDDSTKERS